MATLTTQSASAVGGTTITFASAAVGGDKVTPSASTYLIVKNGSGAGITVTIDPTATTFNNTAIADTTVSVGAGAEAIIPITADYKAASDGLAAITYSAVTTVTVAAIRF